MSCLKRRMMAAKLRKDDPESEFAGLLEQAASDIERLESLHRTEIADMADRFRSVNVEKAMEQLGKSLPATPFHHVMGSEPVGTIEIRDLRGDGGSRGVTHVKPDDWWVKLPSGTYHVYPADPPPPIEILVGIVPPHCSGYSFGFDPGTLHVKKDGSGHIVVNEEDFILEDDRCEGPDGPEGSVHWIARLDASEIVALRDFLNGAKPEPVAWTWELGIRREATGQIYRWEPQIGFHVPEQNGKTIRNMRPLFDLSSAEVEG